MRFLILLAVLVGCKSSPVQYEMIEVNGGEKLQDMYGSALKRGARQVPEVQFAKRFWSRYREHSIVARKDDSKASQALLGSDQVLYALCNRAEEIARGH